MSFAGRGRRRRGLILGQHLAVTGYVAIVLVTVASIGAVRSARDRLAGNDSRLITA